MSTCRIEENAKYAKDRRLRIKAMGKARVPSTKYDAVRKKIQRERAALKNNEKESGAVATINATITNKSTTPKATSTAEAAAILAGK